MAANLPVDFQDDILDSSMSGQRRYSLTYNTDGTVNLTDATTYTQEGSDFGAAQINATNKNVNQLFLYYYGLTAQTTTFNDDGSITVINEEATIVTTFEDIDGGGKVITETITPLETGDSYVKVTTITPATETTGKTITEEYSIA